MVGEKYDFFALILSFLMEINFCIKKSSSHYPVRFFLLPITISFNPIITPAITVTAYKVGPPLMNPVNVFYLIHPQLSEYYPLIDLWVHLGCN